MGLQSVDKLITGTLKPPMLDEFMGSTQLRAEVVAIAEQVKHAHLALLPSETGNLRSTARVTAHRSTTHPDRRWEAEYSIGGGRADYILPLEQEGHYLERALRSLGYSTGDAVSGPTGRVPTEAKRPPAPRQEREREADINSGETVQKPEPRPSFHVVVSGRTYQEALSRDVSAVADELGLSNPTSIRAGRGSRHDYGEVTDSQARDILRHLENRGDSEGFDDADAIRAARAVRADYDRLRSAFNESRPDAPYTTWHQEMQQRRAERGDG